MTKQDKIKELINLRIRVNELEVDLDKYDNYIPMTAVIKGKVTIQLHPKIQLRNLEYNGWRVVNDSDLTELRNYLKH